ncbi:MAG: hypothetical protein K5673_07145 [Lachnospiraceae bacterium]|nr:hypothetical protein [Lachnospiraceae bacterium]
MTGKRTQYEDLIISVIERIKGRLPDDRERYTDKPLTGAPWNMVAEDLVYLVLELMKETGIRFAAEDFDGMKMNTVTGIAEVLVERDNG